MFDVIVVGAGLAGLAAALRLAEQGAKVALIHHGQGGLALSSGSIDVLGYAPEPVEQPLQRLTSFAVEHPNHPYAVLGQQPVEQALNWLCETLGPNWLVGSAARNVWLPTAVGALRPTSLHPLSMSGAATELAIVGPVQLKDFSARLCAANLARGRQPIQARAYQIDLPVHQGQADCSALAYARALDQTAFCESFAAAIGQVIGEEATVGLPAMLGLANPTVHQRLVELIGRNVLEIGLLPPSVPGLRLERALLASARRLGVRLIGGSKVVGGIPQVGGNALAAVKVAVAGRQQDFRADWFVHAAGGFESGAVTMNSTGQVAETLFDLPLAGPLVAGQIPHQAALTGDYWQDQALFTIGLAVDQSMRVLNQQHDVVYNNLLAAGSVLAGATAWSEKSGEGIALGSAWQAAQTILQEL
jgi:glycerol-3-phosphate dehydrogenase subunit B